MVELRLAAARAALARVDARRVASVGVTGQMHGVVLVDGDATAARTVRRLAGRALQRAGRRSSLDYRLDGRASPIPWRSSSTGCRLASGFLGATLFWLSRHGGSPDGATATFIPDYLVARLAGRSPVTDPTNAAGSGLFDVAAGRWSADLLAALGLPSSASFPTFSRRARSSAASPSAPAEALGLPSGTPGAERARGQPGELPWLGRRAGAGTCS